MHPRNIYNVEPDFKQLATTFDSFKAFVKEGLNGRSFINFKDPSAVKELCRCLMKKDFNIELDFPLDRLCPAIPNRLNYILWLEDLLSETMETTTKAKGIDIGVGASCIYPLLACACHPHWSFLGTEIDTRSMDYARKNIERNHLEDRIQLIYNKDPDKIFPLDDEKETFDFCMCNPPFYESKEALEEGMTNKELEPYAVCTGSSNEMITTGGEYGFISKMINESVRLGTRIRWYTSMLGMKKSIGPLIRLIKQAKITNYLVTELTQGKTTRWVIAWSFYSERAFKTYSLEEYHPKCQFVVNLPKSPQFVIDQMECILKDLEIDYEKKQDDETITSTVRKNTWSRAARRQKRQKIIHEEEKREDLFTFVLEWIEDSEDECNLQISWTKGKDRKLFESFWSHVKKRIEEHCGIEKGTKSKCIVY